MRWWTLFPLAALLVAAGAASAQAEDVEPAVSLTIAPLAGPIQPLEELGTTNVTVTVTCSTLADAPTTAKAVHLEVASAPSWSTVTVSPSSVPAAFSDCDGTTWQETVSLIVSTTAGAPAFTADVITLVAYVAGPAGNVSGEATTPIRAGYFSVLEVVAVSTIFETAPGTEVAATVTVRNYGNGPTKVFPELLEIPAGWKVVLPPPLTLESKQTGGTATAADLIVAVQPPRERGYVNDIAAIELLFRSAYALDPDVAGEDKNVDFLVTVKGLDVPAPPFLPTAGVAALLLGRRGSNRPGATI